MITNINEDIKYIYSKQKEVFNKILVLNNFATLDTIDVPYFKVFSNAEYFKINVKYLNLKDSYLATYYKNKFISKNIVDEVFVHTYQKIDSNNLYLEQIIPEEDDDYLINKDYILNNFILKENVKIKNCFLVEKDINNISDNELIGLNTLIKNYVKKEDILDMDTYNSVGNEYMKIYKNTIFTKSYVSSNLTTRVVNVKNPVFYFNTFSFEKEFISKDGDYLNDGAILLNHNNNNLITYFETKNEFSLKKAPTQWIQNNIIKTDSKDTDLVTDVFEFIINDKDFDNKKEIVSIEEVDEVLDKLTKYIETVSKRCLNE